MLTRFLEAVVVLCAVIGFYALMAMIGLFPAQTWPLIMAVCGSYGCYLYGRFGRRLFSGEVA